MESMVFCVRKLSPCIAENRCVTRSAHFSEDEFQNVGWWMAGVDEEFGNPFVGIAEQKQASRGLSVAAGAPDFLIVCLDGVRDVGMGDETNFAAVDAHTERVGGDNHTFRRVHETLLNRLPIQCGKARMV